MQKVARVIFELTLIYNLYHLLHIYTLLVYAKSGKRL